MCWSLPGHRHVDVSVTKGHVCSPPAGLGINTADGRVGVESSEELESTPFGTFIGMVTHTTQQIRGGNTEIKLNIVHLLTPPGNKACSHIWDWSSVGDVW